MGKREGTIEVDIRLHRARRLQTPTYPVHLAVSAQIRAERQINGPTLRFTALYNRQIHNSPHTPIHLLHIVHHIAISIVCPLALFDLSPYFSTGRKCDRQGASPLFSDVDWPGIRATDPAPACISVRSRMLRKSHRNLVILIFVQPAELDLGHTCSISPS